MGHHRQGLRAAGVPAAGGRRAGERSRSYTWPQPAGDSPAGYAEGALEAVSKGYTALKTDPFGELFFTATPGQIEATVGKVAAMREAVGPDVAIAVDGHQRFYPQAAIAIAHALEPLGVLFFEEPVPSDNLDALAKVSQGMRGLRVPLATGERHFTRWQFRPLLERQLVDVIQPDVCHVGGLWELRKIAAMAEPYDVPVAPHNPNGPVGMAAAAQVGFCTPNFLALESTHSRAWQWELVDPPYEIVDGHLLRPERPGLGFELNEAAVRRRAGTPRRWTSGVHVVVE